MIQPHRHTTGLWMPKLYGSTRLNPLVAPLISAKMATFFFEANFLPSHAVSKSIFIERQVRLTFQFPFQSSFFVLFILKSTRIKVRQSPLSYGSISNIIEFLPGLGVRLLAHITTPNYTRDNISDPDFSSRPISSVFRFHFLPPCFLDEAN